MCLLLSRASVGTIHEAGSEVMTSGLARLFAHVGAVSHKNDYYCIYILTHLSAMAMDLFKRTHAAIP
jgi:hypothetical protein